MVYSKSLNALLVLFLLSFVEGQFDPFINIVLTKDSGQSISFSDNSCSITSSGDIDTATSCNSISLNQETWDLSIDYDSLVSSETEFAVGFWVNFETTISATVFQFGQASDNHYIVSSTTDGTLKVSSYYFSQGPPTTDSSNDFEVTVPLNKWFFIVFDWKNVGGDVTLSVILPNTPKISQTSVGGSTSPFEMPGGYTAFGQGVTAKFYQLVVASSASISMDLKTITLTDKSSNTLDIATPCADGTCNDSACDTDGLCITSKHYCTTCGGGLCSVCDPDSARMKNDYCNSCTSGASLINYHCNIYLGCDTTKNCAGCSVQSTVCDSCAAGSFLYDESSTSISCICNFYVACTDSCTSCLPGPECFNCADAIVQDGNTCSVNKVGFQVSFDIPNIVIDFAHPLSTGLSKSSFSATSNAGTTILTDGWTFTGCTAGLKQCTIAASNVLESDLPIDLEFEFTQV